MPQGRVEVITGGMFCGKSEELIRRIHRATIAGQPVQVFKPKIDDRYATHAVVSHRNNEVSCCPVADAETLLSKIEGTTRVVAIDEAQFFTSNIVKVVTQLANSGHCVILAGLDMDSEGSPFGPMPLLMAVADDVLKLHAVCVSCGDDASFTYHKGKKDGQVEIGADQYEARCRNCWMKGTA